VSEFHARLDFAVDGEDNTVHEVNTRSVPSGSENPYGNAFVAEATPLLKESSAKRDTDPASSRFWRIVNTNARTAWANRWRTGSARARRRDRSHCLVHRS
jgi:Cu2+-containing amine oxidase